MQGKWSRNLTIVAFLIIPLCSVFNCKSEKPLFLKAEKEIELLMDIREKALKDKDLELYMRCISKDYSHNSDTFYHIKRKMEKNFNLFDKIRFSATERTIYPDSDSAIVVQEYEMMFIINKERKIVHGREKLFLKREKEGWRIIKGL